MSAPSPFARETGPLPAERNLRRAVENVVAVAEETAGDNRHPAGVYLSWSRIEYLRDSLTASALDRGNLVELVDWCRMNAREGRDRAPAAAAMFARCASVLSKLIP